MFKLAPFQDFEMIAVLGQQRAAKVVVAPALLTSRHSGNRHPPVEEGDAFAVLPLVILDD